MKLTFILSLLIAGSEAFAPSHSAFNIRSKAPGQVTPMMSTLRPSWFDLLDGQSIEFAWFDEEQVQFYL
eukprot:scaffold12189_cov51-Attheya_sp.AAC.1